MGNCIPHHPLSSKKRESSRAALERTMELERREGQRQLREMVLHSTSLSEVDWEAVIAKADELHAKEQLWLRQQNRRQRRRQQERALQKRKKYDAIGSFSVNMLTYRIVEEQDSEQQQQQQHYPCAVKESSRTSSSPASLDDTHSNGSSLVMTKSSLEEEVMMDRMGVFRVATP